jgi:hypothetical protein
VLLNPSLQALNNFSRAPRLHRTLPINPKKEWHLLTRHPAQIRDVFGILQLQLSIARATRVSYSASEGVLSSPRAWTQVGQD